MLTIYRRHLHTCDHRSEGRAYRRCQCPIWVDGFLGKKELRQSLQLRDWTKATETVREWESQGEITEKAPEPMAIMRVCQISVDARARELKRPTLYKYRVLFRRLRVFAEARGLRFLWELNLERLRDFRAAWPDHNLSALKNLERLRAFLRFCQDSDWIDDNPARKLKNPKVKQSPTLPFTPEEVGAVISACDKYPDRANAVRVCASGCCCATAACGFATW